MIVLPEETKERITGDLFEGLYRKRQIGFGKLFKTIKKELDLDDVEDGNLVQTGEDSQEVSRGQEIVALELAEKELFLQLLRNMLVSFIIRCILLAVVMTITADKHQKISPYTVKKTLVIRPIRVVASISP